MIAALTFAGLDLSAAPFSLVQVDGVADIPDIVKADRPRLRRTGLIAGDDFHAGRTVNVRGRITGSLATIEAAVPQLVAATNDLGPESLLVGRFSGVASGQQWRAGARCRKRSLPLGVKFSAGYVEYQLSFDLTDPRLYAAAQTTVTTSLPSGGGGVTFPAAVPLVFSATTQSGGINVSNVGNFPAPWTARIDGPAINPRILNVGTGQFLALNLTLAAGEYVVLDSEARTVLLGGTTSRYYAIASGSQWFDLAPGTTELAFRASTTSAAVLSVSTRSTWI